MRQQCPSLFLLLKLSVVMVTVFHRRDAFYTLLSCWTTQTLRLYNLYFYIYLATGYNECIM